jgi:hypothetical protein
MTGYRNSSKSHSSLDAENIVSAEADIAAQGKCLAVLQRAGHVVHVGHRLSRFSFILKAQ